MPCTSISVRERTVRDYVRETTQQRPGSVQEEGQEGLQGSPGYTCGRQLCPRACEIHGGAEPRLQPMEDPPTESVQHPALQHPMEGPGGNRDTPCSQGSSPAAHTSPLAQGSCFWNSVMPPKSPTAASAMVRCSEFFTVLTFGWISHTR